MTDRERLQELLDERTSDLQEVSRFLCLFEHSFFSIQILNASGYTILVNPAWKKFWNLSDEFVDNFILNKDPLLKSKEVLPYLERAWAGEIVEMPNLPYDPSENGKTGRIRITRPMICPLKDSQGKVTELMLLYEDVTEKHEASENKNFLASMAAILLESLDYNQTLEHIATATIPYMADGCIVDLLEDGQIKRLVTKHYDPQIEKLLRQLAEKFPPNMNSPQPTPRVMRSGEPELLKKLDIEVIRNHTMSNEHTELIRSTGIKSHIAVPLHIRGETIGALNFWITSERRPFDEKDVQLALEISRFAALAIVNARLYRDAQSAISQREDFISIASHELKTPITALMLQMEIIQSIIKDQSSTDHTTLLKVSAGAERQLDRLKHLIDDMLDLTRVSQRKLISEMTDHVDLKQLIQQVIGRFKEQIELNSISLSFVTKGKIFVKCDPVRLEQVVTNLISNALLYGKKRPIEITLISFEEKAVFKIKDYGIGIAMADQKRIFLRFERGFPATDGKGLGLGLFISQQIMEEQGGMLYVESRPENGSTFTFELPLS